MNKEEWEKFRRDDGSIDLELAYRVRFDRPKGITTKGIRYLRTVEQGIIINSRQAAALAITTAAFLDS